VNTAGVEKGVASVLLDGKPLDGITLPVLGDGRTHEVVVTMGAK
jgi:cellobiose phosphorylase/cellobionic acid phosphorylase